MLAAAGHEADHLVDVGLRDADDAQVSESAARERIAVLTKDEDLPRVAFEPHGPAIIWLRVGNCSRSALIRWLTPLLPSTEALVAVGEGLVEIR